MRFTDTKPHLSLDLKGNDQKRYLRYSSKGSGVATGTGWVARVVHTRNDLRPHNPLSICISGSCNLMFA